MSPSSSWLVLLGPFALTVLGAVTQHYPFRTRVVLFVVPILVLVTAEGAEWIRKLVSRLHPVAGGVCMAALFVVPAWAFFETPPPYQVEGHKTALAFLQRHRQPGDDVFIFPYEVQAVERYGPEYGLTPADYEVGGCSPTDRRVFLRDLDRHRGRSRVWLIAGGVPPFADARRSVEQYLATIGIRRESIVVPSQKPLEPVSAQLFDLSDKRRLAAASAETFPLDPPGPFLPERGERVRPLP